jgi:acetylornithine deacetylase/succinyl-diaminopimelate desuccinylase-like protein
MSIINTQTNLKIIDQFWQDAVLPNFCEFVRIPCKTTDFDPDWAKNKYLHTAANLVADWAKKQNIRGLKTELLEIPGRTPVLFMEIAGELPKTVLFYGHLDKMPESTGWDQGFGPWQPVVKNNRLYGRGTVDDGYATYSALTAIKALQEQNIPHPRCVLFIECCEESGSPDYNAYLKEYRDRIGTPDLIAVLDAGGVDRDHLWRIVSLRGHIIGTLNVAILEKGMHSGSASNIIPSTFRIIRHLLDRIENSATGEILLKTTNPKVPQIYIEDAKKLANILGKDVYSVFPLLKDCRPASEDLVELIIANTLRPSLSTLGADGLPLIKDAGNVLRAFTKLKLGLRLSPLSSLPGNPSTEEIAKELKQTLEANPPYGAHVTFEFARDIAKPWCEKNLEHSHLSKTLDEAAKKYYGQECLNKGDPCSIGSVAMFAEYFPNAQLFLSGVDTPDAGAHGPNEFLDLPTVKKFTACLVEVLAGYND